MVVVLYDWDNGFEYRDHEDHQNEFVGVFEDKETAKGVIKYFAKEAEERIERQKLEEPYAADELKFCNYEERDDGVSFTYYDEYHYKGFNADYHIEEIELNKIYFNPEEWES